MKHILFVSGIVSPDIGGPASYLDTMVPHLVERGYAVRIISYASTFRGPMLAGRVPVSRVPTYIPWGLRHMIFFVHALIATRWADVVVALNATSAGAPALRCARLWGKPFVVRIAGDSAWELAVGSGKTTVLLDEFQGIPKHGMMGVRDRVQRMVVRRAQQVIVPSRYLAGIVAGWGASEDRTVVVHNAVSIPHGLMRKEDARRALGISGNLIVSSGRLVSWKGFRMLVKIVPQLLSLNQFYRLVIVGDGPDMPVLQKMVKMLSLDRKVYLVGRKSHEEVSMYLAAADLFVLNTGYEGFSHQLLEAMAHRVPVISTTVGGNREVIDQGRHGILIRYNDEFNLVQTIHALWSESEKRAELAEAGFARASEFSLDRMVDATEQVLLSSNN
jgi:glycosyltransferase involved in cell wall biosynthesis